jgi:CRP-like cAMP-binding protein
VITELDEEREIIVNILHPKEFFGEMALLDGKKRSATVIAQEKTSVLSILRKDFLSHIISQPDALIKMLSVVSSRLRKADRRAEVFTFFSGKKRLANLLVSLMAECEAEKSGEVVIRGLTHSDIAKMVGLTREATTNLLSELAKDGIIETGRRKITVLKKTPLFEMVYL